MTVRIRRRMQVTLRVLLQYPEYQGKSIDGTEKYLQSACQRCNRSNLVKHSDGCVSPEDCTGAYCEYCGKTTLDRGAFGYHNGRCYQPGVHHRSKRINTGFRETAPIRLQRCSVNGCDFESHIYSVWNVHRTLHRFMCLFRVGINVIHLGQLSKWHYDPKTDTLTPPIGILRLFGTCLLYLYDRAPAQAAPYRFDYVFPKHFQQDVPRVAPRSIPTLHDLRHTVRIHKFHTIVNMTDLEIEELDEAVIRGNNGTNSRHASRPLEEELLRRQSKILAERHVAGSEQTHHVMIATMQEGPRPGQDVIVDHVPLIHPKLTEQLRDAARPHHDHDERVPGAMVMGNNPDMAAQNTAQKVAQNLAASQDADDDIRGDVIDRQIDNILSDEACADPLGLNKALSNAVKQMPQENWADQVEKIDAKNAGDLDDSLDFDELNKHVGLSQPAEVRNLAALQAEKSLTNTAIGPLPRRKASEYIASAHQSATTTIDDNALGTEQPGDDDEQEDITDELAAELLGDDDNIVDEYISGDTPDTAHTEANQSGSSPPYTKLEFEQLTNRESVYSRVSVKISRPEIVTSIPAPVIERAKPETQAAPEMNVTRSEISPTHSAPSLDIVNFKPAATVAVPPNATPVQDEHDMMEVDEEYSTPPQHLQENVGPAAQISSLDNLTMEQTQQAQQLLFPNAPKHFQPIVQELQSLIASQPPPADTSSADEEMQHLSPITGQLAATSLSGSCPNVNDSKASAQTARRIVNMHEISPEEFAEIMRRRQPVKLRHSDGSTYRLRHQHPGQTPVPWKFLPTFKHRERLLKNRPAFKIIDEIAGTDLPIYTGPVVFTRHTAVVHHVSVYTTEQYPRLRAEELEVHCQSITRPMKGYYVPRDGKLPPEYALAATVIHLMSVRAPHVPDGTIYIESKAHTSLHQADLMILKGANTEAIVTICL